MLKGLPGNIILWKLSLISGPCWQTMTEAFFESVVLQLEKEQEGKFYSTVNYRINPLLVSPYSLFQAPFLTKQQPHLQKCTLLQ